MASDHIAFNDQTGTYDPVPPKCRCCGQPMTLVPSESVVTPGYEQHTFRCVPCHESIAGNETH